MFLNLFQTFIKKSVYGLFGNVSFALSQGAMIEPQGDEMETMLWRTLGAGAFTGLAGVANRLRTWDPLKAATGVSK